MHNVILLHTCVVGGAAMAIIILTVILLLLITLGACVYWIAKCIEVYHKSS